MMTSAASALFATRAAPLARCVPHETDHRDGILSLDRLDRAQRKAALKAIREADWAGETAPPVKLSPHAMHGRAL